MSISIRCASNARLNSEEPYELYPFIQNMSHHRSTEDQLRYVLIPDETVSQGIELSGRKGRMSMVAGDFTECYSTEDVSGTYSAVVTIFFIDTAPNVLKYIETIYNVLESNGVWINIGPLVWHFELDSEAGANPNPGGGAVELTLSELILAIKKSGFEFENTINLARKSIRMPYMADSRGMCTYMYDTEFWVARKL
jgi:carnosine N-methyltransferase